MHHFTWSTDSDFTGAEVEYMLREYGIRCTSREIVGQMGLSVSDRQAVWAEHLLCKFGVPLTCQLLDQRNRAYAERSGGTMPTPWGVTVGPGDFVGRCVDAIDGLFGHAHQRSTQRTVRQRARRRR